jgi:hypothetical protein
MEPDMRPITLIAAGTCLLTLAFASLVPAQQAVSRITQDPPLLQVTGGAEVPVRLHSADVAIEVGGGFATTTLLLELRNPNDRVLEGTLQFPLDRGQQVAGFALDIGGAMRDAVPVPKARGRQVFESIERRGVDPGLLEQTAGNQFRLRIYPIPAHGSRQVRVVIEEAMQRDAGAWRMAVPVRLLDGADAFSLRVRAHGVASEPAVEGGFGALSFTRDAQGYQAIVRRTAFRPQGDLSLRFPADVRPQVYGGVHDREHFVLVELPASPGKPASRTLPSDIGLLWDASASARNRDRVAELALLDRYFKAMGNGRAHLRILRDVGVDGGTFHVRNGDWSRLRNALDTIVDDGASNLSDWTPDPGIAEYLLVSDGLQDYGDKPFPALTGSQRLYAIDSAGAASDGGRLAALAEARGGRLVAWQGRNALDAAASALLGQGTRIVRMRGDGVTDLQAESHHAETGLLRVAGRLTEPKGVIRLTLDESGHRREVAVPVSAASNGANVPRLWARWRIGSYAGEPERHRAAIARLGQQFSIVTAGTSLLVLDDLADYARYDIAPPANLRTEVARLQAAGRKQREASRGKRRDAVAEAFAQRLAWWRTSFPKDRPSARKAEDKSGSDSTTLASAAVAGTVVPPPAAPASAAREMAAMDSAQASSVAGNAPAGATARGRTNVALLAPAAMRQAREAGGEAVATIRLQAWQPDSPYARRLRAAPAGQIYALYLGEREGHADSTAFYLDVADLLLQKGRRVEGLRVLSNLAELELDNRHVLRVLGYRLMQARQWALAVKVFRQVLDMAEEEPQSGRDLALALAAAGQRQQAIERLYDVALGDWDGRFAGIPAIALNEMNAIVATSPKPLDTDFIDPRLLRNMPLDLRVALSWDSDNSDMDLWVTDPNGEKCYYGNSRTYQGGLISDDFTGGYGPEEFVLRDAKPGRYRVEAHYFGDRQQIVTGATTLGLSLSTGWATSRQQDRTVTLRLSGKDESVLVGEFEVE